MFSLIDDSLREVVSQTADVFLLFEVAEDPVHEGVVFVGTDGLSFESPDEPGEMRELRRPIRLPLDLRHQADGQIFFLFPPLLLILCEPQNVSKKIDFALEPLVFVLQKLALLTLGREDLVEDFELCL